MNARRMRIELCIAHLLLILPLAVFLCFYDLGTGAGMGVGTGIDESWYVQTAQEMKASGQWWLPTREGKIFFYKPPLKFWITEVTSSLFGESMFSYRCVDAFLGVGYVLLTYGTAAYLFRSLNAGLFAAFGLLSCYNFFFVNGTRNDTLDVPMTFICSIALLLLWYFVGRNREPMSRREQLKKGASIGVLVGLAVLLKSVASYYLYGIFALWLLASRNVSFSLRERKFFLGAAGAVSAIIPAFWFVPHALFTPGAWQVMFGYELVARFSHGFHHSTDPFYYWKLFTRGSLIPPLVCGAAVVYALSRLLTAERELYLLLLTWIVLPFAVFSALPSRLEWYVVPCFFPMALTVGALCGKVFDCGVSAALELRSAHGPEVFRRAWQAILCFSLAGALCLPMGEAVARNAAHVYDGQPRLAIDEVQEDIRGLLGPKSDAKAVFEYGHPPFATRERIFYNMIRSNTVTLHSVEEVRAQAKSGELSFFFLDVKTAGEVFADMPPGARYRELTPVKFNQAADGILRKSSVIVIAAGPDEKALDAGLREFKGVSRVLTQGEKEKCRFSSNHAAKFTTEETCTIEADEMLATLPTSLTVKFSKLLAQLDDAAEIAVFVDSTQIGNLPRVNAAERKHRFAVSPGVWKKGPNNITFKLGMPVNAKAVALSRKQPLLARLKVDFARQISD